MGNNYGWNGWKVVAYVGCLLALMQLILSQVPEPHNVKGRVFHGDGSTGVENGIPVRINDSTSGDIVFTRTDAPPIPSLLGTYSATINGSDGDSIVVMAWNATHYGINNSEVLAATTTTVNVVLDAVRPPEANVTIIEPANDTLYNISTIFNVTANVTIIGGQDATNCDATINFSDPQVLALDSGGSFTNALGNMPLGSSNLTSWQVVANLTGSSNISVIANCDSLGNFDEVNNRTIFNISVHDIFAPAVVLHTPANNSVITTSGSINVTFIYNVSDHSGIASCSLIIDGSINETDLSVQTNIFQNISANLTGGNYTWNVNCTDNSPNSNVGASPIFNLTVLPNIAPVVSGLIIDTVIDLSPGSTTLLTCNATVRDDNNVSDIQLVNATFFSSGSASNDPDDNNFHYSNASCSGVDSDTFQRNYTCGFALQYYADNGTWHCNITAIDNSNATGSGNISSRMNELMAIDIAPQVIDYGNLAAGSTSADDINITLTNIGNIVINTSVSGYGVVDGDNLAMNCTKGTVPIANERYSIQPDALHADMAALTDTPVQIANVTLQQRTNDLFNDNDQNSTYWKLQLPLGLQGTCNGTVTFIATNT